ncbi:uncharacterized protein LOC120468285 [Pimephales promelas]|uniref:uncharacterized protein LOC120468285 n=1 Tax=Pimephales promelas TaxID=90988 RepID=UPI00195593E5|nr:uncharacterized protein LOC120468285 [Pimephales promelas]KAG1933931.1 endonuclease domain-containing 1 protein-like [Pimephales promelas]
MFVLGLLTCVVLRAFSAQAKVAEEANGAESEFDCTEFFYKNKEPTGMDQNAKKICQWTSSQIYYFATLYSVPHRIPLYSAYTFNPACASDSGRPNRWYLEPQISDPKKEIYMVPETEKNKKAYKANQATSDDYSDTGYDRGHLNPSSFQCRDGRTATFTLTNAAPMDPCFNRNHWAKWEKTLRSFLGEMLQTDGHSAKVYIVTGTVPDANLRIPQKEISEEDYERVTVPSHIWTAVCYKHDNDDKSFSFGYIGQNQPEEPGVSLMRASNLNYRLSTLYGELSDTQRSITIFEDDCFDDNNKLSKVQDAFKKLINLPENQGVQMTKDAQIKFNALKRATGTTSQSTEKRFKVKEMTVKLASGSMDTYYEMAEDLKGFAGSACLITNAIPQEMKSGHDELRKREVSEGSDAVECLLVPERQMTAADGSQCSSVSESADTCQCNSGGQTKPCCSSPCLYQDKLKGYWCNSGNAQISCSPPYSLITVNGERCRDDHPCGTYGYGYYWCYKVSGSWDFCSPPLWRSKTANGRRCRGGHACAKYGKSYQWCYTDAEGSNDQCCTSDDPYSTVSGKTCKPDHLCAKHGESYLWCKTTDGSWDKCCTGLLL